MANLASFVNELALLAGVKSDILKPWVEANKAVEIPDEAVSAIRGNLLTLEAAKNSSQLYDHFTATALNGVDTDIERFMGELKLEDSYTNEIKGEKKTAAKVRKLVESIRKLEQEKINTSGGDKKVLQEKIDSLTSQVADANATALKQKGELETKIAEAKKDYTEKLKSYKQGEHYSSYTYAGENHKAQKKLASILVDERMAELGLITQFDEETGNIKLLTKAGTEYFKDNKSVDFKGFTDGILAENHLLKVSEPPKGGEGNHQQIVIQPNGNGRQIDTSKMTSALNQSLADVSTVQN